jgi:hypothetical protein
LPKDQWELRKWNVDALSPDTLLLVVHDNLSAALVLSWVEVKQHVIEILVVWARNVETAKRNINNSTKLVHEPCKPENSTYKSTPKSFRIRRRHKLDRKSIVPLADLCLFNVEIFQLKS